MVKNCPRKNNPLMSCAWNESTKTVYLKRQYTTWQRNLKPIHKLEIIRLSIVNLTTYTKYS